MHLVFDALHSDLIGRIPLSSFESIIFFRIICSIGFSSFSDLIECDSNYGITKKFKKSFEKPFVNKISLGEEIVVVICELNRIDCSK